MLDRKLTFVALLTGEDLNYPEEYLSLITREWASSFSFSIQNEKGDWWLRAFWMTQLSPTDECLSLLVTLLSIVQMA